jgi:hypothetical protein
MKGISKEIQMRKALLPLLLATCLMGANPKLYSGLGDTIYDAMPKMSELSDVEAVAKQRKNIEVFLEKCRFAKERGFALDHKAIDKAEAQAYLDRLRTLNRDYEYFVHVAEAALNRSLRENDYPNFVALIQTGLIDIESDSKRIVGFYKTHKTGKPVEEIEDYIAYQKQLSKLKAKEKAKRRALYQAYKQRRIDQVNSRYEAKKEARRDAIDEKTERIKEEVKRKQAEELRVQKY